MCYLFLLSLSFIPPPPPPPLYKLKTMERSKCSNSSKISNNNNNNKNKIKKKVKFCEEQKYNIFHLLTDINVRKKNIKNKSFKEKKFYFSWIERFISGKRLTAITFYLKNLNYTIVIVKFKFPFLKFFKLLPINIQKKICNA